MSAARATETTGETFTPVWRETIGANQATRMQ